MGTMRIINKKKNLKLNLKINRKVQRYGVMQHLNLKLEAGFFKGF